MFHHALKAVAAAASLTAIACSAPASAPSDASSQTLGGTAPQPSTAALRAAAVPIAADGAAYGPLIEAIGDRRFVLLGESTHGSHEYYRERALISERLVRERGFRAIALEADWSPMQRVNLYVRGLGTDRSADQALSSFTNFPRWMWRNAEFRGFVERLRAFNAPLPPEQRVGVYGMDVYDLFDAADAAVAYLKARDPEAARRVQRHYRCFGGYRRDTAAYGQASRRKSLSCQEEAAAALAEMRRIPRPASPVEAEAHFAAVRSAASVAAAEEYFRVSYGGSLSWNVRDTHMARNMEEIAAHAGALAGSAGKALGWAHNSHVGDARATFQSRQGELNIGQLMRQRHDAFLLGFIGYQGRTMAAPDWGATGRVYDVRPGFEGSHSKLFHEAGVGDSVFLLAGAERLRPLLAEPMQQRAIGVIYRPEAERMSHYFDARLTEQFDAVIFIDRMSPVTPLR